MNETRKDLVKAYVAIDSIMALVDKMEPYLDDLERERFRKLITYLQINYAEQTK